MAIITSKKKKKVAWEKMGEECLEPRNLFKRTILFEFPSRGLLRSSSPRLPGTSPWVSLWFSVVSPNLEDELHRQSWLPKTSPSEAQPPQAWSERGGGSRGSPV